MMRAIAKEFCALTGFKRIRRSACLWAAIAVLGCDSGNDKDADTDTTVEQDTGPTEEEAKDHCPGDLDPNEEGGFDCVLKQDLTEETAASSDALVWIPGVRYRLFGTIVVRDKSVLTIEPGAVVVGDPDLPSNYQSMLVIEQGAKLHAVGTIERPIVFTSGKPKGERASGDWGGLVVAGYAPIACGTDSQETYSTSLFFDEKTSITIGGQELEDSSGALAYVRIEFAGRKPITKESPVPGLSLLGVGTETELHHVQIHRPGGVGLEIVGGGVPLRHIVVDSAEGAGVSWKQGWVGRSQFVISHTVPGDAPAPGMEGVNNVSDNAQNASPRSKPMMYNYTIAGDGTATALRLAGGTSGSFVNFLVAEDSGYAHCVEIEHESTWNQTINAQLTISGSIFPDLDGCFPDDDSTGYMESHWWESGSFNRLLDVSLEQGEKESLSFAPEADSPALKGALPPPTGVSFFEEVSFVGGVGSDDWTEGWTAYPEN